MKKTANKAVRNCLIGVLAVYCIVAGIMFTTQRDMLYIPGHVKALPPPAKVGLAMQEIHPETADGLKLVAWFVPPKDKDKPVVVFFHGNAGSIANRAHIAKPMLDHGYGFYMCEYRGYGGNPGQPTEEGLYNDARAALKWLESQGFKKENLVYSGESLGTGVAVQMATEAPPRLLILQSPYTNVADVAQPHFWYMPVSLLVRDKFDSLSKIGGVKAPLLILHGEKDGLIPIALARKLYAAANEPKEFIPFAEGTHNDLYQYGAGDHITAWMERKLKQEADK